ncbi:hypothetical protein [Chryseobacterium scophthalmum]|uniref:hypothetical protein n=1 Tax=Chryseobacterium scophthalmum TaxID=59733 RepID=UPI003CFFFB2B
MIEFLNSFSNREISILFWTTITFSILIFIAKKEFLNVLKAFFHYKILTSIIAFSLYCISVIFLLSKINYWDISLIKDTIIWFLTAGIVVLFNINKVDSTNYFINVLKDNLKVILFLEFVINFYTFGLITELIIIPIITCITILFEYSKYTMLKNSNHIKANKALQQMLSIIGITILIYVLYKTISDYKILFTESNIKSFYLPIILSVLTIPFYYFLAIYMIYEEFFIRLNLMFRDKKIENEIKKNIILTAGLNINKITKIKNVFEKNCIYEQSIKSYIKSISR